MSARFLEAGVTVAYHPYTGRPRSRLQKYSLPDWLGTHRQRDASPLAIVSIAPVVGSSADAPVLELRVVTLKFPSRREVPGTVQPPMIIFWAPEPGLKPRTS